MPVRPCGSKFRGWTWRRGVPKDKCPHSAVGKQGTGAQAGETSRAYRVRFFHRWSPKIIEGGAGIIVIAIDLSPNERSPRCSRASLSRQTVLLPAAISAAAEAEGYAGATAIVAGTAVIAVRARRVVAIAVVVRPVMMVAPVAMVVMIAAPMTMAVARTDVS